MSISRRSLLKGAAVAGAATALVGKAEAREHVEPSPDAGGMLYDSTRCIGCRACVTKCKEANGLPYDTTPMGAMYDAPPDLSNTTKNVIKVLATGDGKYAFM